MDWTQAISNQIKALFYHYMAWHKIYSTKFLEVLLKSWEFIGHTGQKNVVVTIIFKASFLSVSLQVSDGPLRIYGGTFSDFQETYMAACDSQTTAIFATCWLNKIDGLLQERRNSSALAMELCLSRTNPSKWSSHMVRCDQIFKLLSTNSYHSTAKINISHYREEPMWPLLLKKLTWN